MGVVNFGHPNVNSSLIPKLYDFLNEMSLILVLPLQLLEFIKAEFYNYVIHVTLIATVLLFTVVFMQKPTFTKSYMIINFSLLLIVSITISPNTWAMCLSCVTLSHFFAFDTIVRNYDVPKSVLDSIGTCFLCFFVVNTQ